MRDETHTKALELLEKDFRMVWDKIYPKMRKKNTDD